VRSIPSVNLHLLRECNYRCVHCFATFADVGTSLPTAEWERLIDLLLVVGTEKITFAGGEPTLHRDLGRLLGYAKTRGVVTGVVTNGARLAALLDAHRDDLDWVGLSVDSASEEVQAQLGRGNGGHVRRAVELADRCHREGVRVKLNTVVTSLTWQEDMSELVRRIRPARWKVLQVLRVIGQNDGRVEPLLVTGAQFAAFVGHHAQLAGEGMGPIPETNEAMIDSYVMIDPLGRFRGDTGGRHYVSAPILEVGVEDALSEMGYSEAKLAARGGLYDWKCAPAGPLTSHTD
jgi:radical S-adenosyl methionine domain-containing protein 2